MKKLLALLLAIVMIFALCACGSNDDDDEDDGDKKGSQTQDDDGDKTSDDDEDEDDGDVTIVGKWSATADLAELFEASMEELGEDMDEDMMDAMLALYEGAEFEITLKFDDNGKVEMFASAEEAMETVVENIEDDPELMVEYIEATLAASGMTAKDYEEMTGQSIEDYVEELIDNDQLATSLGGTEDLEETLQYELNGDELTITDEYDDAVTFTIALKGSKLTFEDYEASGEPSQAAIFLNGTTFKRK